MTLKTRQSTHQLPYNIEPNNDHRNDDPKREDEDWKREGIDPLGKEREVLELGAEGRHEELLPRWVGE